MSTKKKPAGDGRKIIAQNRKARHEYFVVESYEAGIELRGTEVKSIRENKVSFQDAFAGVSRGEVFLHKLHISPYSHGNRENHDPLRKRRLLLHKREILKISQKLAEKGLTLIPLSVYLRNGLIKIELGLCRGKKLYDKRQTLMEKDTRRRMERAAGGQG